MTDKLDKSLDDIIVEQRKNKSSSSGPIRKRRTTTRNTAGGGGNYGNRGRNNNNNNGNNNNNNNNRRGNRNNNNNNDNNFRNPLNRDDDFGGDSFRSGRQDQDWQHDRFNDNSGQREISTKIQVSNLADDITSPELQEIFAESGPIVSAIVLVDDNKKSKGVGEVIFATPEAASAAVESFDQAEIDGRPISVKLVKHSVKRTITPAPSKPAPKPSAGKSSFFGTNLGGNGDSRGGNRPQQRRDFRPARGGRGGSGGRGGRGRGGSRNSRPKPQTAEELNSELDDYNNSKAATA